MEGTDTGEGITALNVVVATPEARGGAIRAGLQLGEHLREFVDVDTVKMSGDHDDKLATELGLTDLATTPPRTLLRDIATRFVDAGENIENTVIWTEFSTPRPLPEYDIVHLHNAVPLWGLLSVTARCWLANVPYVLTTHGISKLPNLPDNAKFSRVATVVFEQCYLKPYRHALRHAAHLFALSEGDEIRLENYVPGQSVSVIPNGVGINRVSEASQREIADELGVPTSRPLLLFVGKIMESKGVEDLLDAHDLLDTEYTLVVVGPNRDDALADRLGDYPKTDVRYLGYTSQDYLDALFALADLFVFPTRSDVFPLVVLEAMAAGTPVVTTEVGGIPEQVSGDAGVLVPPEDPVRIADTVSELLADPERCTRLGEAARRRVIQEFAWETVAERTTETYAEILSERTCLNPSIRS